MGKRTPENITLGSGIPYFMEFTGTMPEKEAICVDANRLGYIKSGASLEYTTETYVEKDDLGYASKTVVTSEEVLFKMGLLTWNGNTLQKLADRCQVDEDKEKGLRTIKLGGAGNAQGKEWVICFFHEDKKDGNLWVMIRGTNAAGFTLTFAVDEGTLIEPEFTALPQPDGKGTLVTIIEEMDKATA